LGNVSHELRAPAGLIRKGAERLIEELRATDRNSEAQKELNRIIFQAEHQERLLGDLIDLSRAEIDELDLERLLVDPRKILAEAFDDLARRWKREGGPEWKLSLPRTMPAIEADPTRIRQILYNLLGNAAKFTEAGKIELCARCEAGWIELRVEDTGRGIAKEKLESVFDPFVSSGGEGIGLGLSISRHLALLHGGSLEAESAEGRGSAFILRLPLPSIDGGPSELSAAGGSRILLVSSRGEAEREIAEDYPGFSVERITAKAVEGKAFNADGVAALAWYGGNSGDAEWETLQALRRFPPFRSLPFLIYGDSGSSACVLPKGSGRASLIDALAIAGRNGNDHPILAADDDPEALAELCALLARCFPNSKILRARDGEEAWAIARDKMLKLAVLDISMPRLGGLELIERMRADERLAKTPVLALTSKAFSLDDVKRLEGYSRVALGVKGVWSAAEAQARVRRLASGEDELPAHSSALVKRALVFIHRNYGELITRWRLADEVNVSEDYLTRLFKRELGLSPWEYLSRYRIKRAKELLETTDLSVAALAEKVGFSDQAYFSRVFRKLAGMPPQAWRDAMRSGARRSSSVLYDGFDE
jgi:AraC-like DNA-binding protein